MTAPPPRRPWWKRKRAWAAVALWLAVAYPATFGPAVYAFGRGWVSADAVAAGYAPIFKIQVGLGRRSPVTLAILRYQTWWHRLAARHAASD